MGEPQRGFQHPHQGAARGAFFGLIARVQLNLGQFQIPIAIFVPHELIDRLRCQIKAVLRESIGHFLFRELQAADDPFVHVGKLQRQIVIQAHVVAFAIHQHEARSIPQLVAKVAITIAALQIEFDVAAVGGEAGESEAQCIGAEGGNALGEFFARGFFDGLRLLRVH